MAIREILNHALFESIYEDRGRYSVPPEWLLRGLVLQALYGIRTERLLCEQLNYNMLYRWFFGPGMKDAAWDHSTYTQNRNRRIEHEVVKALFGQVMKQAEDARLLSSEHFSVDGTLIRAWASHKSFVPKGRVRRRTRAAARATLKSISSGKSAATTPMAAPPTRRRAWPRSRTRPNRSLPTWVMC